MEIYVPTDANAPNSAEQLYDIPAFGNVSLLHYTDCHAQLLPIYYREPSINLGVGSTEGKVPHLVGMPLLDAYGIQPGSRQAYAFSHLNFDAAARAYGKVGGFAHLASLVKRLKADRPKALLLDGGDSWQGSATALWTAGQDMVEASLALGVDIMTGHWEFSHGAERVLHVVRNDFKDKIAFIAQNIAGKDDSPVFDAYVMREQNGIPVAIIGQAFPYTPMANGEQFVPGWDFGIDEMHLQAVVDQARSKGAQVVVLLSHNGMDIDLKLATRITGIDMILGGHTHDGVPVPSVVRNAGGKTIVTNAGSHGKFLAVIDFDVKHGRVADYRYHLLPVFSELLPADPDMQAVIDRVRAPFASRLQEPIAESRELLYRRGNFNGTWDQLIVEALMQVKDAEIAFSPGFRWGTTLLPGQMITRENLMEQTAITYPHTSVTEMTGAEIKQHLEKLCDKIFNDDPYQHQGGDMVRTGGLIYMCEPAAEMNARISNMTLHGQPVQANKLYKVAKWGAGSSQSEGEPIWDVVEQYLKSTPVVKNHVPNVPRLTGMHLNPGFAYD
ncbi:thiosulfohydrolase SoxB [Sulfuriferula sp. AH1]|uniref:thiosulfohydrolase SoxB n=1 Tax=Sulfuriferula sp. AH1 TaxID=1985873 RepID=UPI000B3B0FCF|nr:thiosulfohydrolase SoxB [Sulfuriferula sp. AH1]ARU32096.1 thiosulfohydrolase SoxB [Sulfuriferula sp. AH1]